MKIFLQKQPGMSLVEVLVATIVLGITVAPLIRLAATADLLAAGYRHQLAAINTAQGVIEEIKAMPFNQSGKALGGDERSITLETAASSRDNHYLDHVVALTGGPGAGQTRKIIAYDGFSRTAEVDRPWNAVPQEGATSYMVFKGADYGSSWSVAWADSPDHSHLKTVTVTVYYHDAGRESSVDLTTEKLRR